jgi:hypothetical protein
MPAGIRKTSPPLRSEEENDMVIPRLFISLNLFDIPILFLNPNKVNRFAQKKAIPFLSRKIEVDADVELKSDNRLPITDRVLQSRLCRLAKNVGLKTALSNLSLRADNLLKNIQVPTVTNKLCRCDPLHAETQPVTTFPLKCEFFS